MVTKVVTKSNTTYYNDSSRRSNLYIYNLKYKDLSELQVCKKIILGTLDINEFILHNWLNDSNHGIKNKSKNTISCPYDTSEQIKLSPQSIVRRSIFLVKVYNILKIGLTAYQKCHLTTVVIGQIVCIEKVHLTVYKMYLFAIKKIL